MTRFIAIACLMLLAASSQAYAADRVRCRPPEEIRQAVDALGNDNWIETYDILVTSPLAATCALINELKVVDTGAVPASMQDDYPATMHIIWCVRMLRAVTGLRFTARTQHTFGPEDVEREFWIMLQSDTDLPFFTARMSSDSVFIAPGDTQSAIIDKWAEWYDQYGEAHRFPEKLPSIDDWYY